VRVLNKNGAPRQTAGDGMVLQTRPETPEEFGARAEPLVVFCRREIPRLHNDINEYRQELWQMHQNINECAKFKRWYRNTSACIFYSRPCEYFEICANNYDVDGIVPSGFAKVEPFKELQV
jgi:hypothetical protein